MAKEPVKTLRDLNRRMREAVADCDALLRRSKRMLRESNQDN